MESASAKPSKFLDSSTLFLKDFPPFKNASSAFTKYFFLLSSPILSMMEPASFSETVAAANAMSFRSSKYKPFFNKPFMLSPGLPVFRLIIVPFCSLVSTSAKSRCNTVYNFQNSMAMMPPISSRLRRSSFLLVNGWVVAAMDYLGFECVINMESLNFPDTRESAKNKAY